MLLDKEISASELETVGKSLKTCGSDAAMKPLKISYLHNPGKFPLISTTVGQLVVEAAERFGNAEAVYFGGSEKILSFNDVHRQTDILASGLLQIGLKPGDVIGIFGPNSMKWYLFHLAAAKAGLVSASIHHGSQRRELVHCINKANIKALVVGEPCKSVDNFKVVEKIIPRIHLIKQTAIKCKACPTLTTIISMEDVSRTRNLYSYSTLLKQGDSDIARKKLEEASKNIQFDDPYNILYTSGTTGAPKAVMLGHHGFVNNGLMNARRMEISSNDKICVPLPLSHLLGSTVGILFGLFSGALTVFPSPTYSSSETIKTVERERCTIIFGTPTMHIDMMNLIVKNDLDVASLRLVFSGAATCTESFIRRMKEIYTAERVAIGYGQTEVCMVTTHNIEDSDETIATTVGYPYEHLELKIVDPEGHVVPLGTSGELWVRAFGTMLGYFNDEDKTKEVMTPARWIRTGDIMQMQESGHLRFIGRIKDMLVRGGENIFPKEIEDFLSQHPSINEVHVFGMPDPRLGEVVAAWINPKDGAVLTE